MLSEHEEYNGDMCEKCKGELRKNCEHKGDEKYKERDSLSSNGAADQSIIPCVVCSNFFCGNFHFSSHYLELIPILLIRGLGVFETWEM